jgi:hypothetical protein
MHVLIADDDPVYCQLVEAGVWPQHGTTNNRQSLVH